MLLNVTQDFDCTSIVLMSTANITSRITSLQHMCGYCVDIKLCNIFFKIKSHVFSLALTEHSKKNLYYVLIFLQTKVNSCHTELF